MMNDKPWFNDAWTQLTSRADQRTLPHALLVAGPKGIGKHDFALNLAEHVLGKPATTHPDFFELTPEEEKKNITVNQVRGFIQKLAQTSHQQGHKVAVIYPAEAMNIAASNAILKTLEEPLGDTLLILCSHQPSLLLPTVVSRCQRVKLGSLPAEEYRSRINFCLADAIQKVRDDRGGNRPTGNAQTVQDDSGGDRSASNAQTVQNDSGGDRSAGNAQTVQDDLCLDKVNPVKLAEICAKEDIDEVLSALQIYAMNKLMSEASNITSPLVGEVGPVFRDGRGGIVKLFSILDKITAAKRSLQTQSNPNKQLLLENLLLEFICN